MGVTGLWPILAPSARPTPLPTLNRKRLAVDASIWIYQFLKAVRDKEGNALRNSHVVGFFRRICKLLYFGIKPVFVFDGGAPVLKRQTVLGRKKRREGRREDAVKTAGRLLAVQMKKRGEEEEEKRRKDRERERAGLRGDEEEEVLPDASDMVYVGELGMDAQERVATRKFHKKDAYHLPDLPNLSDMGQPNDPRVMSAEELEEYARQFNNGEDVNLYDFSKIDFNGEFFMSLPAGDRYNILNAARLRSRLRMGLSKEQLEEMFPDRMAFSKFQIERVRERNELTQRLMNLNGMNDDMAGVAGGRIAGERGREYVLVKNDGVEGGWALGVVNTDKSVGERNKPIDVDALHQKIKENEATDSEDEFEDVPVEGLNRLPKPKNDGQNMTYDDYKTKEMAVQRRQAHQSRDGANSRPRTVPDIRLPSVEPEAEALFIDDDSLDNSFAPQYNEEEEDLNRAIALSLRQETDPVDEEDEEDHINRAIALSMQKNHRAESESEEDGEFEDVPMPTYEQRAVTAPKPLTSSRTSGSMIAHIVNNRANAAVPKRRATSISSGSDSDMDFQSALAKARKGKAPEKKRQPVPVVQNSKNPFDGPLPFESLGSIFGRKQAPQTTLQLQEEIDEDMGGGFDNDAGDESRPLPPWLAASGDIRADVSEQQQKDLALNAEDRERALEEERVFRRDNGPIQIDSDDESDVEILDKPPTPRMENESDVEILDKPPTPRLETMDDVAEVLRAEPLVSDIPDNLQPIATASPNATGDSDEEIDWSESEHGDVARKPQPESADQIPSALSKSPSPDFEDVEGIQQVDSLPEGAAFAQEVVTQAAKSRSPIFENASMPDSNLLFPSVPDTDRPSLLVQDSYDREQAELDAEFDLSDPEDDELLAQLAIEAEEHARFASTLNNKSERENQDSYEKELKALRSQQKKDRRDADEVSHIMITECQALLRLFGIPYITAPMEAEAQCAELVRLGLVDGIVTDDSDIFLFGGTRVYKNMFNSNKFVECYLASDLEKELSLSRYQLISIAHLLGSDYTEGLQGIGPVTAVEILSEFPTENGLQEFKDWWATAQISATPISAEQSTFRKKFRRSQATKLILPNGFPSQAVTEAYLKPDVDATTEPFQWGVPDLDRLRDFLMATIGWTQERTDEVLVPVIRDMNRREQEGTQANITRYFDGTVGVGANTGSKGRDVGSKRMKDAVSKLKAKKQVGLGGTWADAAKEWASKNEISLAKNEELKASKKRARGKKRAAIEVEAESASKEGSTQMNQDIDGDDENDTSDEYAEESAKRSTKKPTKRKRTKT